MKKKIRTMFKAVYKLPFVGVCLLLLLASCETSGPELNEEPFIFRLSLPPALSVDTRGGTIDETTITNVWVFQFNTEGKKITARSFGTDAITPVKNSDGTDSAVLLQVTTDGFSNISSTFWVIANFGTDQADLVALAAKDNATVSELQAVAITYSGYSGKPSYLVSNSLEYKSKEDDTAKAVILAPLNYAFAWITVKWENRVSTPAKFQLASIKACNLPAVLAVDTRGGGTSVYPESAAGTCDVAKESTSGAGIDESKSFEFYMPENLRGMGCGATFQQKNLPDYGPTATGQAPVLEDGKPKAGGGLANCTYIDLEGSYWYPNSAGTGQVPDAVAVRYRLYLGGNLMNDYNIRRGYHYTITVQISGINSGDVRVTITDGAVVVFDDVETITKEVEFK